MMYTIRIIGLEGRDLHQMAMNRFQHCSSDISLSMNLQWVYITIRTMDNSRFLQALATYNDVEIMASYEL